MSNNILDAPTTEKSILDKDLKKLYKWSIILTGFCCLSWVWVRIFFWNDLLSIAEILLNESDPEMTHIALSITYLLLFFLLSFILIIANTSLKKIFIKDKIAMTISFVIIAAFLWLVLLIIGLLGLGVILLLSSKGITPYHIDFVFIGLTIGLFLISYQKLKQQLLLLNKKI